MEECKGEITRQEEKYTPRVTELAQKKPNKHRQIRISFSSIQLIWILIFFLVKIQNVRRDTNRQVFV